MMVAISAMICVSDLRASAFEAVTTPASGVSGDDVPLDPHSPWPKFRRDAAQTGRSPLLPRDSGQTPWMFPTGKGVFSSPVIDGDGTVYVGSADRNFYAIGREGALEWKFATGEIIDSAALLDNQGRVIFGSGDGHVYALDRTTGALLWKFAADSPSVNNAFINWFEGNIAIGGDGTLYAPNDNFCTYALRRTSGEFVWCWRTRDQTWSLPALDPASNRLFIGNNFAFARNVAALNAADGRPLWRANTEGSVAASPLLARAGGHVLVIAASFDGYVRAYDPADGRERWRFGARDHLYASAAEMADGTIIQPSADGTIYALDPSDGSQRWAFDAREPIRSSPAIDGAGNIYVGSGEGRLFVLGPDGALRWSIRLIEDARDDLNASPALGTDAVVIAGENGGVFSVPYDYCLRPGLSDRRCSTRRDTTSPPDGASLLYTTAFGRVLDEPPAEIDANASITLSLLVRRNGRTALAVIDSASVRASLDPVTAARVDVSGDGKFVTIVPREPYAGGVLDLRVQARYLVDPQRHGLRFRGGEVGGELDQRLHFSLRPRTQEGPPLLVPRTPGDRAGAWELYRVAAPLPTILPSYNQIGFDSIHYLIGLVEGDRSRAVAWAVGGQLADADNRSAVDPSSRVRFPLEVRRDGDLLTLTNEAGFTIEFNGFPLPFEFFRAATRLDAPAGEPRSAALNSTTTCGKIDFYGEFLQSLGYCNPDTDQLIVAGAAALRPYGEGSQAPPDGIGRVRFDTGYDHVTATFTESELRADAHNAGLLLVDVATGRPLPLNYSGGTTHTATADGKLASVTMAFHPGDVGGDTRVYAMVDTYPGAVATVHFAESVPWHVRTVDVVRSAWSATKRSAAGLARRLALRMMHFLG